MTGLPQQVQLGQSCTSDVTQRAVLTLKWGQKIKYRVTPVCTIPILEMMAKSRFSPLGSAALWTLLLRICPAGETEGGSFA